jgi:hypothetical protein
VCRRSVKNGSFSWRSGVFSKLTVSVPVHAGFALLARVNQNQKYRATNKVRLECYGGNQIYSNCCRMDGVKTFDSNKVYFSSNVKVEQMK